MYVLSKFALPCVYSRSN